VIAEFAVFFGVGGTGFAAWAVAGLASDQSDVAVVEPLCRLRPAWVAEEAAAVATVASLLRDRVTLQVRSVDRLFLQA
jgi:hypothetical protein